MLQELLIFFMMYHYTLAAWCRPIFFLYYMPQITSNVWLWHFKQKRSFSSHDTKKHKSNDNIIKVYQGWWSAVFHILHERTGTHTNSYKHTYIHKAISFGRCLCHCSYGNTILNIKCILSHIHWYPAINGLWWCHGIKI
jgi:hypothetical protein